MKKTIAENHAQWLMCEKAKKNNGKRSAGYYDGMDPRAVQFANLPECGGLSLFRRTFSGDGVTTCRITASALGVYELFCNGERVGTRNGKDKPVYDELKPGWTNMNKRVFSDTYDLTPYLRTGENLLVAVVAPGWWCGRISYNEYNMQPCAFRAELSFDGTAGQTILLSDEAWECRAGGRVRTADIWDGEYYDAREDSYEAISVPGADAAAWDAVTIVEHDDIAVTPRVGPQVRVREGLDMLPVSMTVYDGVEYNGSDYGKIHTVAKVDGFHPFKLMRGQTLQLDFAQEMVGWPQLKLIAKAGTKVTVRVGEFLNDSGLISRGNDNPEGSIYTINYRTALAKIHYICNGAGEETYCPMFTFFGYRYLEIKAEDEVEFVDVRSLIVGSEIKETGTLETSSPLVNRLIQNIIWGQRGNYLSVPTDCPQRDERLGWTGDTQIFSRTAAYNGNVRDFFRKWLGDARDSQDEEGSYPDVIPRLRIVGKGAAAWGDAGIIVPYQMYLMFNDTDLLAEHYESMEKYMDFLHDNEGPRECYGDWVSFEPTDKRIISLAYYAMDAKMMAAMSAALRKPLRARHYEDEYARARNLFRDKYVADGKMDGSQCAYLMALKAEFLNENEIPAALTALKDKIVGNGYRLSTGFVGTGVLNQTLSAYGLDGLAYSLLLQEECPSWLYSVKQGATTMWERWNSYTLADGFGPVSMNSFNHYAYGAVGEWMYRYMCGIETDGNAPGFAHVILQPRPDLRADDEMPAGQQRITRAAATYRSINGPIASSWEMKDGTLTYTCSVPVGATLTLPMLGRTAYVQNGERKMCEAENDKLVLELQPGTYTFEI